MNYLVMEVHPAYAVVLDEEGRFLKAANLHYQVGDTVHEIIALQVPRRKNTYLWKAVSGLAGLAACFCLIFFGYYQPNFTPYGSLRIQINPDVELTLSRTDHVLDLEGLNPDGEALIAGYSYSGKDREEVAEELVERAIHMGYLSNGETVAVTVDSSDADWRSREEKAAVTALEARYGSIIEIQAGPIVEEPPAAVVVIPVPPTTPEPTPQPTPEPTPQPTPEPTATPTPEPTPEPTPQPTPQPTPKTDDWDDDDNWDDDDSLDDDDSWDDDDDWDDDGGNDDDGGDDDD